MCSTPSASRNNNDAIQHGPSYNDKRSNLMRGSSEQTPRYGAQMQLTTTQAHLNTSRKEEFLKRFEPPSKRSRFDRREEFLKRFEPPSKRSRFNIKDDSSLSFVSSNGSSREARYLRKRNEQSKSCPSMKSFNTVQELVRCAFENRAQMNPSSLAAFWNQASCLLIRDNPSQCLEPIISREMQCLYAMTYASVDDFGTIHISEILNAMGNIVKRECNGSCGEAFLYDLLAGNGVESKDNIFHAFANIIVCRLDKFGTRAIVNVAMAFAHIGLVPECYEGKNLFYHIAQRALRSISHFSPEGLSKLAWSFAKVNVRSPQLFAAIVEASERCMKEFNPQSISIMLWGFARNEECYVRLFEMATKKAISCLSEFKPQELTNTVHAFATSKHSNHTFFEKVGEEAEARIESFIPQNLANIVWAYATLGVSHPRLFKAVAKKAISSSSRFSSQELSTTAWAFATAKVDALNLFHVIAENSMAKLDKFEPQHLSNIVWAFATSKIPHRRLFEAVADSVLCRRTEFSPLQISTLIWSYAYVPVGSVNIHLYSELESIVIASVDACDSQFLANIAWSYAVANVEAPCLFQNRSAFVNAILSRKDKFSLRELCQLHQWILWQKEIKSDLTVPSNFQQLCYNAYIKRSPSSSAFQRSVISELKSIGLEPQEEYLLADCGYMLDALVEVNGESVGIEVDGPCHFAGREPLGKMKLKHRQVLNIEGIRVVSIPYWKWDGNPNKQEYLKSKLDMIY
ncbi:hypothetical protein HJC23_012757 [Cyclotella cryptica]|uniref:RAP domain-containing protein n=1 Tax=Cyclotella cryptica TaxID=29204 RepID=A0ABD3Q3W7_9STRA|eukprot:CCRYP_008961-RA/>CCRYP_008961-RA protein AED:0.17 eAED:-0.20 QI:0/-1/0/1/-1/1/1/0/742